jgi:hypothetical protein
VEKIDGRRKLKRGYEYEVQWKNLPMDKNEWLTRDQLEEMGESLYTHAPSTHTWPLHITTPFMS